MVTIAIVSPGHMGAGLGWALREGGARVVCTVAGRSERTVKLARDAGLETLPDLVETVGIADVVLIVTPPGDALNAAHRVASAAAGVSPLVADLNATAPPTMDSIVAALAPLDVVDGSISGPPPTVRPGARLYFSGPRADEIAALPWRHVTPIVLGDTVGTASALKMCTASVYKGLVGVYAQAMRVAAHHGVLDPVLADLRGSGLDQVASVPSAVTKAARFVDEMREIAATQAASGLTPALFEGFAEVYAELARTPLADSDPESIDPGMSPADIIARLNGARA